MVLKRQFLLLISVIFVASACSTLETNKRKEVASIKMQMGISEMQKNNLPEALRLLLEAEELDAKDHFVQNNLGLVYFFRKKYDQAIKHFSRAIDLNNRFTEARNNLARVYIEIKQYKIAENLLAVVVEDLTFSNYVSSYNNMGLVKFNLKKYEDALTYFNRSVESYREDCFSQLYLGRTLLELGKNKLAAARLDSAAYFCRQSRVDDAHYYGAIAYYRLGKVDQSLNRFSDVIKLFDNNSPNRENAKEMIQMIEKDLK